MYHQIYHDWVDSYITIPFGHQLHILNLQKNLSGKSNMKILMEQFSSPFVDIIFVCKICRKEQKSNWQRHFNTHSDERPHTCQYCGKGYKRADVLSLHIKKTHQEKVDVKMEEGYPCDPWFQD